MMTEAGYDAATGMYGVFDTRQFNVPDCPTRAEAEAALALCEEAVRAVVDNPKDTTQIAAYRPRLIASLKRLQATE